MLRPVYRCGGPVRWNCSLCSKGSIPLIHVQGLWLFHILCAVFFSNLLLHLLTYIVIYYKKLYITKINIYIYVDVCWTGYQDIASLDCAGRKLYFINRHERNAQEPDMVDKNNNPIVNNSICDRVGGGRAPEDPNSFWPAGVLGWRRRGFIVAL